MRRLRKKQNMLLLTGWLFADMFIVIAIIFIASTTMAATPPKKEAVLPTPAPVVHDLALKPNPIEFTVFVNADLLIAQDPGEMEQARSQILKNLKQQHVTGNIAGIVLIFGGGSTSNQQAVAMEAVLRSIRNEPYVIFKNRTVYKDFIDLQHPMGEIGISIYTFV